MKACVYILLMWDWRYYIGSTNNIERRFKEHQLGKVDATKAFQPLELLFNRQYESLAKARDVERKLKKQKSRTIIEKFISNKWQAQW